MASQEVVDFIRGRKVPDTLLKKLKTTCLALHAVLNDAEEKEFTNLQIKEWLDELKDAVYDAEDLLDEIAAEALQCQLEAKSKVRNCITCTFTCSEQKLKSKIEEVLVRLDDLAKQMDLIGLREGVGLGGNPLPRIRLPTTSLVKETRIIGRDDVKEPIVNLLLSNDAKGNEHLCVIPIAGMGGIGKTTLAQLIYNDQRITEHFSIRFWVCVSEEFDVVRITKSILEAVTSQKCDTTDFNMIQTRLKKGLMGKKFLLVLDDVWNENYGDWELLKNPFKYGTLGKGFLQQVDENKEMEEIGNEYFLDLVSRSLLQRSNGKKFHFVMHALVHDLAKFVSGRFNFRLEGDYKNNIINKTRHFSYLRSQYDTRKKFEALYKAKHLRTFLPLQLHKANVDLYLTKKVPQDLLLTLRYLRVLSLSHYTNMIELPERIGDLQHLRYLDVSCTKIERSPYSICRLCNLQTLNLSECKFLVMLPSDMQKLINLRHLNITGTSIQKMPIHMGRLQCLRTLTKFIVEKDLGFQIGELGELSNLWGAIVISKLQNVINPTNALSAKLKAKRHLDELTLEWDADYNISLSERDILNNLQPHTNLKKLVINNYKGTSFPNWIGDHSFSNITVVHLNYCRNCPSLPSLGKLPSLQDLSIVGFDEVVKVGPEFYGSSSSNITPFRSLEILKFERMLKWEEWFPCEGGVFPRLQEFYLWYCPKLSGSLPKHLPSLTKFHVHECSQLQTSLPTAPAMRELTLKNCNDVFLKELPPTLQTLRMGGFNNLGVSVRGSDRLQPFPTTPKVLGIYKCRELQFPLYQCYSSLKRLFINDSCSSLISIPLDIFPKLDYLQIKSCCNMESLLVSEGHQPIDLVWLEIEDCLNLVAFPSGGLLAPNLTRLKVDNCPRLNSLPQNMHTHLPSLELLEIINCPQIESFPEGGLPSNLINISIGDCKKLISTRMEWGLQRLQCLKTLLFGNVNLDCWDVESFPEEDLLPTSLRILAIVGFRKLRSLDNKGLQHLTSLQQLFIVGCPGLKHMPEDGLPCSISYLEIEDCPSLTKLFQRKKGKEWRNIAHIPTIKIDDQVII
uniref:Disease resistance RPP13-like protein 1 n=1 Tax=Quercus lobata TaxID=97700 RepID=A0A7N2KNG3_QUELO